jgi:hypothetical protein
VRFSDGLKFLTHGGGVADALLTHPLIALDFLVSEDGLSNNVL